MDTPADLFEHHIKPVIGPELAKRVKGVYVFDISGPNGGVWRVDLKDAPGVTEGDRSDMDISISLTDSDFVDMVHGRLNPQIAYMTGKMIVEGNSAFALKILKVLNIY